MPRRPLSLALRLISLIGGVIALVLIAFDWVIVRSIEAHFAELDADQIDTHAEVVIHALAQAGRNSSGYDLPTLQQALAGQQRLFVRITDANGNELYQTPGADLRQLTDAVTAVPTIEPTALYQWQNGAHNYRGAVLALSDKQGDTLNVALAIDMNVHLHYLAAFYQALGLTTLGAFCVLLLAVGIAVHQGHAPLRRITAQIHTIHSDQLHIRLQPHTLPEELVELASSFNEMLERIEQVFLQLSYFSADIAHELRTPVTNLMTQTQVALNEPRGVDEYREILYSSLEEYERMAQMIGDMLFLAKTDNGLLKPAQELLDLGDEIRELFDFFAAWAEEQEVRLELLGEASGRGDRLMLRRALSNLLSNAIRHSPAGGTVKVRLDSDAERLQVVVENTGETISPEHLARLFDRFYRVDPARRRHTEGTGLGLALVKSIVEAHGGKASVRSASGITRFQIELPINITRPRSD